MRLRWSGIAGVCVLIFLLVAGCSKKDSNPQTPAPVSPEDDLADMIASNMSGTAATYGLSAQMEDVATLAESGQAASDTTIQRSVLVGTFFHYSYTFHYQCGYSAPRDSFWTVYSMRGYSTNPEISTTDTASGTWSVLHVAGADSLLTVNGTYTRHGLQNSLVREKNQYASLMTDSLLDIRVNKATKQIQSGVITIVVTGTVGDGSSFTETGTLTFFGASQASLILNDKTYLIDLSSGTATLVPE